MALLGRHISTAHPPAAARASPAAARGISGSTSGTRSAFVSGRSRALEQVQGLVVDHGVAGLQPQPRRAEIAPRVQQVEQAEHALELLAHRGAQAALDRLLGRAPASGSCPSTWYERAVVAQHLGAELPPRAAAGRCARSGRCVVHPGERGQNAQAQRRRRRSSRLSTSTSTQRPRRRCARARPGIGAARRGAATGGPRAHPPRPPRARPRRPRRAPPWPRSAASAGGLRAATISEVDVGARVTPGLWPGSQCAQPPGPRPGPGAGATPRTAA